MFGCGADVHNWWFQSCSWLRPGRDPSLYSWASGSHPVSSLALWNCCQRTWRRFNQRGKALVMEQIEQWELCLGGLPCKAMSGGECGGYEVVHFLWYKIPVENQGSTSLSSFLFFSKIQGVRNNLQPLLQLRVPLEIGLSSMFCCLRFSRMTWILVDSSTQSWRLNGLWNCISLFLLLGCVLQYLIFWSRVLNIVC